MAQITYRFVDKDGDAFPPNTFHPNTKIPVRLVSIEFSDVVDIDGAPDMIWTFEYLHGCMCYPTTRNPNCTMH